MQTVIDFLLRYGYLALFLNVFSEQLGVPIPAIPMLLAMGMLAGQGKLSWALCLLVATAAALVADTVWYWLGRTRGHAILNLLCRVSLEPDSCVSDTKEKWNRFGGYSLLVAKFVPGLSTVSTPLAGLTGMPLSRFIFLDSIGSAAWAVAYLGLGYLFRNEIERGGEVVQRLGSSLALLVFGILASYLGWKYYKRQRFIRELRMARVTPEELLATINSGRAVNVIDLRSATEVELDGLVLPAAIWIDPARLPQQQEWIPKDQEIVLYCSCPNEASSARAALLLLRRGALRVRPLAGGIEAWRELGYPLSPLSGRAGLAEDLFLKDVALGSPLQES